MYYDDRSTGMCIFGAIIEGLMFYATYQTGKAVAYKEMEDKQIKEDIAGFKKRFEELKTRGY